MYMDDSASQVQVTGRRRLISVLVAVVIVALLGLSLRYYPRLRSLLQPTAESLPASVAATRDVRVQRGPIDKVVQLAGTVQPDRVAKLAFLVAKGQVTSVAVFPGQEVEEGQLLVELDLAALQRELAKTRADLLQARGELDDLLKDRGLTRRIQLEEELRQARSAIEEAEQSLQDFLKGKGTPQEERARAAKDLSDARDALEALLDSEDRKAQLEQLRVIADLAEIEHGPYVLIASPSEEDRDREWLLRIDMQNKREAFDQAILQSEMDVRAAEQRVKLAERALAEADREIAAGSPAAEQMKREAALAQAQSKVDQLVVQLQALDEGSPDVEIAKARANVTKLEGRASDAEAAVAEAALVAPFAGVVGEIKVNPGDTTSPGAEVLTLLGFASFHVSAQVNEMDVAELRAGQDAQVRFDAFPGQTVDGRLGEIPSFGTYQNGLTVFEVMVSFDPDDLLLRPGMSANVSVRLFRKDDVLIVPAMAVQRDEEGQFVLVVQGRQTERRHVQLGISDGINVEVVQGLEKGEVVRLVLREPDQPVYW
jgi:HlyD family secretion protein